MVMKKHWPDKIGISGFWPICWPWNGLVRAQAVYRKADITCKNCLRILKTRGKRHD